MTSTITRRTVGAVVAVGFAATGTFATAGLANAEVGTGDIAASSVSAQATQNFGLTATEAKVVQGKLLKKFGYTTKFPGKIDGKLGTNSWKAFQVYLKKSYGYTGKIDGDPGKNTVKALQRLLRDKVGAKLTIDGDAGPKTQAAFKKYAAWLAKR